MGDDLTTAAPCRDVTGDEIEHLHEHGWVKLAAFADPDALARVLEVAREQMGEDGDGNPLRPVIEQVGTTAKRMLRRRTRDGSPLGVRYYQDLLAPKLPASKASRHGGNGATAPDDLWATATRTPAGVAAGGGGDAPPF